jgi:hypothetical protein
MQQLGFDVLSSAMRSDILAQTLCCCVRTCVSVEEQAWQLHVVGIAQVLNPRLLQCRQLMAAHLKAVVEVRETDPLAFAQPLTTPVQDLTSLVGVLTSLAGGLTPLAQPRQHHPLMTLPADMRCPARAAVTLQTLQLGMCCSVLEAGDGLLKRFSRQLDEEQC